MSKRRSKSALVLKPEAAQFFDEEAKRVERISPLKVNFTPKTNKQIEYIEKIRENILTLGIGSAGTGKTYIACATALDALKNGLIDRIYITKPAVEVGGNTLGFLPGDINEKFEPFARSVTDNLYGLAGTQKINKLIEEKKIEIVPLNFMRGLTFDNCFIIADEIQNATYLEIKTLLTRVGENTTIVLTGDTTQSDLNGDGGLPALISIIEKNMNKDIIVEFGQDDIVRSGFAREIVIAFANYEKRRKRT